MTRLQLLSSLDQIVAYGQAFHAGENPEVPALPPANRRLIPGLVENIAIVGGKEFDQDKLGAFMVQLKEKYPNAIIFTGQGIGAERQVQVDAQLLGFQLIVPPTKPEWYGKDATTCQINDVLIYADVVVTIGSEQASRPKRAKEIWKRTESCKKPDRRRPYFNVAAPPKKAKAKARRPKKPNALVGVR